MTKMNMDAQCKLVEILIARARYGNSISGFSYSLCEFIEFLEDYKTNLDVAQVLDSELAKVAERFNPDLAREAQDFLSKKQQGLAALSMEQQDEGLSRTLGDLNKAVTDAFTGAANTKELPKEMVIPQDCSDEDFQKVLTDILFLNQCHWQSWTEIFTEDSLSATAEADINEINSSYLWINQALGDMKKLKPGENYSIHYQPTVATPASVIMQSSSLKFH